MHLEPFCDDPKCELNQQLVPPGTDWLKTFTELPYDIISRYLCLDGVGSYYLCENCRKPEDHDEDDDT